jgi:hypothetical protein
LAKIALELQAALAARAAAGAPGLPPGRSHGPGWSVDDVLCTVGPRDRPFEERHSSVSIAIIVAGGFEYRSTPGRALMTPGALLLGSPGQCFECGREHDVGDRCLSFRYASASFEALAAAGTSPHFGALRLPPFNGGLYLEFQTTDMET